MKHTVLTLPLTALMLVGCNGTLTSRPVDPTADRESYPSSAEQTERLAEFRAKEAVSCEKQNKVYTENFSLQPYDIRILKAEERKDDPYVLPIAFRSSLGKAGSTTVDDTGWFTGRDIETLKNVSSNTIHRLPDENYSQLNNVKFQDIIRAGKSCRHLTFFGSVNLVFEGDLSSDAAIMRLLGDLDEKLETFLTEVIEETTYDQLGSKRPTLQEKIEEREDYLREDVTPSKLKIASFLASGFGDPDDYLGFHVNMYIPVSEQLFPVMMLAVPVSTNDITISVVTCPESGTCKIGQRWVSGIDDRGTATTSDDRETIDQFVTTGAGKWRPVGPGPQLADAKYEVRYRVQSK